MSQWKTVLLAALVFASVMAVPALSDDGDAATENVYIYSDVTSLDILSHSEKTFQIVINNNTGSVYDIRLTAQKNSDQYDVTFGEKEFSLDRGVSKTVDVTVTTAKYADTETGNLIIRAEYYSVTAGVPAPNDVVIPVTTHSQYSDVNSFNKILGTFSNPLPSPLNSPLVTSAITIVIWIVLGAVMSSMFVAISYRLIFRRDKLEHKEGRKGLKQMWKSLFIICMMYGITNTMVVYGVDQEIIGMVSEITSVLFILFGGIVVWKIVKVEINAIGERLGEDGRFDPSIIPLFLMIAKTLVITVTAFMALAVYGVDMMSILMGLGLITTGISFGAKNIINQFLSGTLLLAERPFVREDKVKVAGNDTVMIVKKVGYMTTRFKSWVNEEIITIPNSNLMENPIVNITKDNDLYRVYDYFSISYTSDLSRAKEIMMECALEHPDVIADDAIGSPNVRFDNIDRTCINIRLSFLVNDHENYGSIAGEIRYRIFARFCEEGIDIPYDQYTVNLIRVRRADSPDALPE
ncbi:MAG: mechanosensitive ion channel domain-containing protein [Candidatus Methanomethylophilaceae archaeon]